MIRRSHRALLAGALALAASLSACTDAPTDPSSTLPASGPPQALASSQGQAVLFGPARFTRATGAPQAQSMAVAGGSFASFRAPFVLHVQNGGADGSSRVTSASVLIDGVPVFGPRDFNQQVGSLRKEIAVHAGSVLTVENAGRPGSYLEIRIEGELVGGVATIGPEGGEVELPGLAGFRFPAGFFGTPRAVQVERAEDAAATAQFEELEGLFRVGARTSYQVRLLAGSSAPADGSFQAALSVPADLVIPAGHRPELFARIYEDVGMEVLDNFQLFSSTFDPVARTLTATLPSWAFTDSRRGDGRFEALFMIGTTPGGTLSPSLLPQPMRGLSSMLTAPGDCQAGFIGKPVAGDLEVSSPYGERVHPIHGTRRMHWGSDFAVGNGTQVIAAADGTIERIRNQGDTGYGLYVILRHADGSATLYAHLQSSGVTLNQPVRRGDPIARSNDSGGSTGPHLHFEYVPNGEIIRNKERIDPTPCMQSPTVTGSITVRDNGSLADDAFAVHLDGIHIGSTAIGASNNFAINNLIPGAHTLRITGIVVPDNVGTYEIILATGITFSDGSTRRSGTVPNQGSASFGIAVPTQPSNSLAPTLLMRPNRTAEVPEG